MIQELQAYTSHACFGSALCVVMQSQDAKRVAYERLWRNCREETGSRGVKVEMMTYHGGYEWLYRRCLSPNEYHDPHRQALRGKQKLSPEFFDGTGIP